MAEVASFELNDKEVKEFLAQLGKRLSDIENGERKYMGLLSAIVFQDVNKHFEQEQGSTGPWSTWSPAYRKYMEKIGRGGNKKLQFTGRMRQNFKPTNTRKAKDGILWFNDAKTKTGFPYAWAHDTGEGQPERDFMWLSDAALDNITNQTLAFMLDEGV